ncbi:MAG: nitronate monooxygenase [Candidatus Eremiobacteraeota bacterium]|nr:nitronate monooxygenase [Candidatus Eremiobacteraeota bacterium]
MTTKLPVLDVPIVLAPLGGVGTPELAAAVSNAGGLGFLPCAYSTPAQITEQIAAVRRLTDRPFGVNLFVETQWDEPGDRVRRAHERLRRYRNELGIPHAAEPPLPPRHYRQQVEAVLAARPAVFSFTFGILEADVLERARAAGIATLGTATTVDEALALERAGVDAICAQGAEAGAHRGTFLAPVADSLIGTLALVPQIVDAVQVPVVAAGGIGDGRGVAAVLALGAMWAQLGTAFLLADESGISPAYRHVLAGDPVRRTTLTTAFSGRAARGIRNRFIEEMSNPDDLAPYPYQNALTRDVRTAAAQQNRSEFLSLWAGQAAALAKAEPAATIVARLMREAREAAQRSVRAAGLPVGTI